MESLNHCRLPWGTRGGLAASAIGLNVLPRQAGGPQSAVKHVAGQSPMSDEVC